LLECLEIQFNARMEMMNKAQPFRQHHVTRALRGAVAAGVSNPSCTVRLPGGATITIDSKPEAASAVIPKSGKASRTASRSVR
jgi:hypothetical protein